jgi:hypothetical protein
LVQAFKSQLRGRDSQTHRQPGDLTCVLLLFKNKENKLKTFICVMATFSFLPTGIFNLFNDAALNAGVI